MVKQDKSLRSLSKEMRLSLGLTQQELAGLAAVSEDDVDCFERSLPVQLGSRQKIIRTLCRSMKLQSMSTK